MKARTVFYVTLAVFLITVAWAVATRPLVAQAAGERPSLAQELENEFAALAEKVKPSVVYIDVTRPVDMPQGYRYFEWDAPGMPFPPGPEGFEQWFGFPSPGGGMRFRNPRARPREQEAPKARGVGSGVIIDAKNGYVLTNNHVVEGATEIGVTLHNDKRYEATLKGTDPRTDMAVIEIKADGLQQIVWGDSDALKVGHWVMAFGQPEGLKYTVTKGIVSAKGRANLNIIGRGDRLGGYEDFIQTDAAINPGNSGGPLTNMKAELVGINTAIATQGIPQWGGIGFAIPSNLARKIAGEIIEKGEVVRGYIGVSIMDMSMEPATPAPGREPKSEAEKRYREAVGVWKLIKEKLGDDAKGAFVGEVSHGQPAEAAGIKVGDVIVGFSGKTVATVNDLRNLVADAEVGKKASVELRRLDGDKLNAMRIAVEIARQPGSISETAVEGEVVSTELGLTVQTLTPDIAQDLGYDKDEKGVVVSAVEPDSRGAKADIREDDLITQIKYKGATTSIESAEGFEQAVSRIGPKESFSVLRKRQGQPKYVRIE